MDVKIRHKLIEIEDCVSDRFVILKTTACSQFRTQVNLFKPWSLSLCTNNAMNCFFFFSFSSH